MEKSIYMPNEIFEDTFTLFNTFRHKAFTYGYYYYVSYLYRYCEYDYDKKMTQKEIKQKLGYSGEEKRINYIIKNGGLLDMIQYTRATKDYPVTWYIDKHGLLEFETISENRKNNGKSFATQSKNFTVKYPIKCFYRTDHSYEYRELDGTFYDTRNTHKIMYSTFNEMMEKKNELGIGAFFIYGYLKWKTDMFGKYRASMRGLMKELGLSSQTLCSYFDALEQYGYLKIYREVFVGKDGEANQYRILK